MPIAKIYHSQAVTIKADQFGLLSAEIEKLLLKGFSAAVNISGEVLFIPVSFISFGKDLYIEVECRQEAYYVPKKLNQLSADLERLVQGILGVDLPCKVRILAFDNNHIYWSN